MQTKKYRLQTEMENLKIGNEEWFKDYLRQVLESDKSYFEKADFIAYSINQIQNKIDYCKNRSNLDTNNGNTWTPLSVLFGH